MRWLTWLRAPTPEELRKQQLLQAQRDLVAITATMEYAAAMRGMLLARVARLEREAIPPIVRSLRGLPDGRKEASS